MQRFARRYCRPRFWLNGRASGATRDSYSVGKSIFFKEVICQSCPYAGRGKDATDAKALRNLLNSTESKIKLDADSKEAINEYLNSRFKLSADKK
ncbi:MAG: hypothetical protein HC782_03755 [Gammaproteobacteria bacterium]|nr:hypothetical protein [Gammaproteobacteria bacterium]